MQVGSATAVPQAAGGTTGTGNKKTDAGSSAEDPLMGMAKSDFMKLLVAQLHNQDPFKPMEDKEFISQMAQLNTVEQVTEANTKLTSFMNLEAMGQASALIGKSVEAQPKDAEPVTGIVSEVRMEKGKLVMLVGERRIELADVVLIKDQE